MLTRDAREAVAGAHAVYGDVWLSMGDPAEEREVRFAALEPYRISSALVEGLDPEGIVLHCLPAHRGEEIDADGARRARAARSFDQARTACGRQVLRAGGPTGA